MNTYCRSALNQLKLALTTTVEIMDTLDETDLGNRPSPNKHSIGEVLEHIALICRADLLIAGGATKEEMDRFYSSVSYRSLKEMRTAIFAHYGHLEEQYSHLSEDELQQPVTSYWGVNYSRYEWLLEIVAHVYHHRGQLHAMLVHCYGKDPKVALFE